MSSNFGTSHKGNEFVPLLFAGDINVYSMSRAFHEAFGCIPTVYGKYATGVCMNSAIMTYIPNKNADQPEEFIRLVHTFARDNADRTVLLLGCGDSYVELIADAKSHGFLPENVVAPYIDIALMEQLTNKEHFYELCDQKGIDRPDTFVYHNGDSLDFVLPFEGPFILKPSNGPEYWAHPYETQKKVYKLNTVDEIKSVIMDIYGAGYEDSVIIQNFIPGDDSYMRVLTSYSDRNGKVKAMCLGHVILEEHTPHGLGNHAVILTERDDALMMKFKDLLEDLHYTGFSNFDIKYDERDRKFKAFEINTRQGRSNYYMTQSGANLAELVVGDVIDGDELEFMIADEEKLWTVIPMKLALKYANPKYREEMTKRWKAGNADNPMYYNPDRNTARNTFLVKNQYGQYYKFWKYCRK